MSVWPSIATAAFAFGSGASALELVATPAEAFARKAVEPGLVLVGEVGGRPIAGFEHGNSPERMAALELAGRTLVLRSSSGVQGALAALASAEVVLLGSLVTAAATVDFVRELGRDVTLVAMGAGGSEIGLDGPEDDACAELLAARLEARALDLAEIERRVRSGPSARAALDPAADWITPGDLALALEFDRFAFAIRARLEGGRLIARRSG